MDVSLLKEDEDITQWKPMCVHQGQDTYSLLLDDAAHVSQALTTGTMAPLSPSTSSQRGKEESKLCVCVKNNKKGRI